MLAVALAGDSLTRSMPKALSGSICYPLSGHVKLKVYVPDPANAINGKIFPTISNKRIVKGGVLKWSKNCGFRCDIATMKRVGDSNVYRYVDPFNFPGNWQDTPGRYYWQVFYYPEGGVGVLPSAVGSFRIN